ncbi:MAG: nucleotidyltransferase [Candidatus Bipolaricaulota bacterium]|nr:nucleotidyltransferase [Candidatus Bipolaricaulota bacterium]MCS7274712.1 nucleotidyltransferase [Candidatus Bipolaricaulota bacterium]MDW8109989.1 nucleotidyltransferase [Candidatus Bipolaricaulota bacterium]MDW8328939.1 nucleotidyltransferase [Candidatus Bipolaricaulota bacterium]
MIVMTPLQAAAEIAEFLEQQGIAYVLLGGLAVQYWGEPRTTRDVDVTVLVPQEQQERFFAEILARFRPRLPDALDFARRHRVLLVETQHGVPVDISLGIPGYEEEVMRRAISVSLSGLPAIRLISAEDLIIHKCVAGRARDREDIENILIRQQLKLDLAYIRQWLRDFSPLVDTHDVQAIFEESVQKAQQALHQTR